MSSELLIIGTSGLAREVAQLARQIDPDAIRWSQISFVAEDASQMGGCLTYGYVRSTDALLLSRTMPADVVIGIGHPKVRRKVAHQLSLNPHFAFPNLIHPSVDVDISSVSIGHGNIITKGVVITCDISIGNFNLLNWNTTIGHDVIIGSHNVVNPGCNLSGYVSLGDACLIGTGAQVLERKTIASDIIVGAGAVVTRSLTVQGIYVGIPARQMVC